MTQTGSCMCGGVTYEVTGELRDVINCHCDRCRRSTGHFMAATSAQVGDLQISGEDVRWYDATDSVQYGFCHKCGSTMFWRASDQPDRVSIATGTLDPPTGLTTTIALFVADASDYHELDRTLSEYQKDH